MGKEKAHYFMDLDEKKANHIARSQTKELENRRFIASNKLDAKALELMNERKNIAEISPERAIELDNKIELIHRELLNITTQKRVFGGFYRNDRKTKIKQLRESLKLAREKIKSEFAKLKLKFIPKDNEVSLNPPAEKPLRSLSSRKLRMR